MNNLFIGLVAKKLSAVITPIRVGGIPVHRIIRINFPIYENTAKT